MARLKYLDNNNQWQSLSSIRGPAGPQGPQGLQGPPSIVNLNGYEVSNPSFYAATTSGTLNQILVSQGEGQAPEWQTPQSDIEVINNLNTSTASDTKALGAYEGYILNQNKVDKAQTIAGVDMQNNITVSELVNAIKNQMLNLTYPIGSIYISINSTNPSTLFGGSWERIQNKFLLASGSSYSAGSTGGEETHTLTIDEIPGHDHPGFNVAGTSATYARTGLAMGGDFWNVGVGISDVGSGHKISTLRSGGGQSHNNMPPYLAVYVWKRTA